MHPRVGEILDPAGMIDLDRALWHYIGAKAGNLPGDLTFSWYAEDRTGQGWVVSMQTNWSQYRSPTAASWLLSIARQMFGMVAPR